MGHSLDSLCLFQVLSAATIVAKHTSALCNACRIASSKTANPVAKRHFVQSAKEVANSTANLVKTIKVGEPSNRDEMGALKEATEICKGGAQRRAGREQSLRVPRKAQGREVDISWPSSPEASGSPVTGKRSWKARNQA